MNKYGAQNWENFWEKLEREGNIGLDYVINPTLYPKIVNLLAERPKSVVVDFGCGTNVMGIQLLFGYQSSVVALRDISNLDEARFNTLLYIGIEGSEELVRQSNKYFEDIGNPKNIATIQAHIEEDMKEFFDEGSIDLCVSRNFLMHLSDVDLSAHLAYVRHILKEGGKYLFATLNPDYELAKVGEDMKNGQAYSFAHGKTGEYGTFYHYYRTREFFEGKLQEYFDIDKRESCMPITDRFRDTHTRYYNEAVPMANMYVLKVKKQ